MPAYVWISLFHVTVATSSILTSAGQIRETRQPFPSTYSRSIEMEITLTRQLMINSFLAQT